MGGVHHGRRTPGGSPGRSLWRPAGKDIDRDGLSRQLALGAVLLLTADSAWAAPGGGTGGYKGKDKEKTFTEHWTMALDGNDKTPWRLVGSLDGAGVTP